MNDQPKTKRIKERLHRYTALLRDIDNQRERLDRMETTIGSPSGPDLSGMPRPQGGVSNPVAAAVEKKLELEEKIQQKEAEEKAERRAIEAMTELMDDPDERLTIQLKYLDRAEWPDVTDKADAYQRRMYRVHGRALLNLAEIEAEVNDSN